MAKEMRLVSINKVPCKNSAFADILSALRSLNPRAPIQLEMEASVLAPNMEASEADPLSVSVQCAPSGEGEECDITFDVQVTLEPWMAKDVRFKQVRSKEGQRLMMVESVKLGGEAFRRGMRPKMVLKSMV